MCQRLEPERLRAPVGWYHSHTRSEIFLSDADLAIHNRFFPEPWQVALVLKPHTFEPMRAGFFFREHEGSMRTQASYREFRLEAMPLRTAGDAAPSSPAAHRQEEDSGSRATLVGTPLPPPVEPDPTADPPKGKRRVPITREIPVELTPPPETIAVDAPPGFQELRPERAGRVLKAMAILAAGWRSVGRAIKHASTGCRKSSRIAVRYYRGSPNPPSHWR